MSKISVLPPSGFRDFSPEEASARAALSEIISRIYRSYGFQQITTPAMENLSTLQGKGGGTDNEKLIFKILKRGEDLDRAIQSGDKNNLADMGMRFDLTLPLARFYAKSRAELPKPFKVFHIGSVWRADRPQKGRFREFVQCDVDVIGSQEIGAEYDCISAIMAVFEHLSLPDVEVHVNDRRLLAAIGAHLKVEEKTWGQALIILDKLDKIGVDKVKEELGKILSTTQVGEMMELLVGDASLDRFAEIHGESTESIGSLLALLKRGTFNPSLVRGQDYYTGTIFELRHPTIAGSLAGGGRYNRLLEIFGAESTPAFGGSIGFERLHLLLTEQNKLAQFTQMPQVFLPLFAENLRSPLSEIAQNLRARGIRVDMYPDATKLKHQFKYADDRQIPFVASLGEDELAKKEIKFKNMQSREEESLSLADFYKKMELLCKA